METVCPSSPQLFVVNVLTSNVVVPPFVVHKTTSTTKYVSPKCEYKNLYLRVVHNKKYPDGSIPRQSGQVHPHLNTYCHHNLIKPSKYEESEQ